MSSEYIFVNGIMIFTLLYTIWKSRKAIKDWIILGFSISESMFLIEKKEDDKDVRE